MNKEQTIAAIAVMQAYVDGAEIEIQPYYVNNPTAKWEPEDNPEWTWEIHNFRIKPKPREFEVMVMSDGKIWDPDARVQGYFGEKIKVREVIE